MALNSNVLHIQALAITPKPKHCQNYNVNSYHKIFSLSNLTKMLTSEYLICQ